MFIGGHATHLFNIHVSRATSIPLVRAALFSSLSSSRPSASSPCPVRNREIQFPRRRAQRPIAGSSAASKKHGYIEFRKTNSIQFLGCLLARNAICLSLVLPRRYPRFLEVYTYMYIYIYVDCINKSAKQELTRSGSRPSSFARYHVRISSEKILVALPSSMLMRRLTRRSLVIDRGENICGT